MNFEGIQATDISSYTKLIEKIAKDLHSGNIKSTDFNEDLVRQIYGDLNDATGKGYGKTYTDYTRDPGRKMELEQNVFKFSAAKTYQEQARLNFLLKDEKGNRRTYAELKKEAAKMNLEFNQNYLNTEVNTFQRQGAQAEKWGKYNDQKGLYPNLQYKTAGDDRVRDDHDAIDDVIKPIDDKFWDRWYPPNGWNCRCYVVQTTKGITKGQPEGNPTLGFQNNPGKTGKPMDEEHPYFIFPKKETKAIKRGFEKMKESLPLYREVHKNGTAKVRASLWTDPIDLGQNLIAAKRNADRLNISTDLLPHSKIGKNPEFYIKKVKADNVVPQSAKLKNAVKNAFNNKFKSKKQLGKEKEAGIVLSLNYEMTLRNIIDLSKTSWDKFNSYKSIKFVIIHTKDKSVYVPRTFLKKGYGAYFNKIAEMKKES